MRTGFDLAPLYRSTVGFDRFFDLLDGATRPDASASWPPYNIEKVAENSYRVTMAVAGFGPNDIEITQEGNDLLVSGHKQSEAEGAQVLHRGIASRAFRQSFSLAEHVKVTDAQLENGLLVIELVREIPEAMKPRKIAIGAPVPSAGQDNAPQLEDSRKAA